MLLRGETRTCLAAAYREGVAFALVSGCPLQIVVITGSYALFQTANNTGAMSKVSADQRGAISGLLNLSRYLGLITGASAMGAVFAVASGAADSATAHPAAVAMGMRVTFAVAAALIVSALILAVRSQRRS